MDPLQLSEPRLKISNWALIITANLALGALILASPKHAIYDEAWFLDTLSLLKQYGLSIGFLREFPGAAGPTYTFVFAIVGHLFKLSFPWLRFVNVILLFAAAVLIWRILVTTRPDRPTAGSPAPSPAFLAASLTTLPTVGVSAGLALTEMPALFFMTTAQFLLVHSAQQIPPIQSWAAAILCGLCVAAAVLGRQNYLVMLPCLLLAVRWTASVARRGDIFRVTLVVVIAALTVAPVFIVWGGLLPPRSASNADGFSLANGIRSAGYAGLIAFLFVPEIYRILAQQKALLAAVTIVSLPLSLAASQPTIPMASVTRAHLGEALTGFIAAGFGYLLSLSAIAFLVCFGIYLWQERMNWFTRLCGSAALLGILSNAKITHQFSSRYVFIFLPFIVLAVAPAVRTNWHQPLRLTIGASISLGALASYFFTP